MAGYTYDVTQWPSGNPHEDIGEVINSIIADIREKQRACGTGLSGRPGAVISIPPGDYHLRTQVLIDVSYLKIQGYGHGFVSSSIRYNLPEEQWDSLHEVWPGGSRILVDLQPEEGNQASGAAFYVAREGSPRISSVEFENFCIDGLHFVDDGSGMANPENSYLNGKTGIYVASAQDSFRITGMGFVYLEHGLVIYHADALSVHDNFIAECGNCVELRGWGQASKVTDNLMGAGYRGHTIYAEHFGGLMIAANNLFPRGRSSVHLRDVARSTVTGNRFHAFYPGMLILEGSCAENLIAANHFLRDNEPWAPLMRYDNGLDDLYGIMHVCGSHNTIQANHLSVSVAARTLRPAGVRPVIIHLVSGIGNLIAGNHIVAIAQDSAEKASDSCFSAQVDALTSTARQTALPVIAVKVEAEAVRNTVLDSGAKDQIILDTTKNAVRFTPLPGEPCV